MSAVEFEAVSPGTQVELVKKVTCSSADMQNNKQYLVMGSSGSELPVDNGFKSVSLDRSLSPVVLLLLLLLLLWFAVTLTR